MAGRTLAVAAAFGAAANAFLLPPSFPEEAATTSLDWTLASLPQYVRVPCAGCQPEGHDLFLNISVGSDPETLEIGGKPFYPPSAVLLASAENDGLPQAHLISQDISIFPEFTGPEKKVTWNLEQFSEVPITTWVVAVSHPGGRPNAAGEEMVELELQIQSVEHHLTEIPNLRLEVLKDSQSRLVLLGLSADRQRHELARPSQPDVPASPEEPKCTTRLCLWQQRIKADLEEAAHRFGTHRWGSSREGHRGRPKKPCFRKGGRPRPTKDMHHGPSSHHGRPIGEEGRTQHRPHHHNHHGHHAGHRGHRTIRLHCILHKIGRFILAVAIPIMVGISVGMLTYLVGMCVGCTILVVFNRFFRGGRRGYASVSLDDESAARKELEVEASEKTSFESAPPVYEPAPEYEEKEVV